MPEATLVLLFTTSFVVGFSGAVMPGPLLVITIKEVATRGFLTGPLLVLGHGLVEISLVIALVLGLRQFVRVEAVSGIIGIAGGALLIWMGLSTLSRGWRKIRFPDIPDTAVQRKTALVLSGIVGSVSNPYFLIWWATIGTIYLVWSLNLGIAGIASFYSGHILADFSWYALIALVLSRGKKFFSDALYRYLVLACGVALTGLGSYFVTAGVRLITDRSV